MGVFARLLRRSKASEKAQAAETQADTPATGSEAQEAEEADKAAGTVEAKGSAEAGTGETVKPAAPGTEAVDNEGVEIPKQQSTEEAADNEAGEGART